MTAKSKKLSSQVKSRINKPNPVKKAKYEGDTELMISTGSTLLDLAISGGRVRGGGVPSGILVEVFGPSGSGKTVLLSEIAGDVQRKGGGVMFNDPEARLNKQFAKIFDLDLKEKDYLMPDTVPEVFEAVRKWQPKNADAINGVFADSLAALSTDLEMKGNEGDKMGARRAKEFSEQTRRTCRVLVKNNYLMVCSNQIRQKLNAAPFTPKYTTPGGEAVKFYASLRLKLSKIETLTRTITVSGKKKKKVVGVRSEVEIVKSSVWEPEHKAVIRILFDYGIDDIAENLQYIKDNTSNTVYTVGERTLSNSLQESITIVEEENLEKLLQEKVIALWEEIEDKFKVERKKKQR